MGEVFNDDSILDMVLGALADECLRIKFTAEADDDFTLYRAVIRMRNMYANRAMRNRPSRKAKGRESTMKVKSTTLALLTCSHCKSQAIYSKIASSARERCRKKPSPKTSQICFGVACITQIATIITTVRPKNGTTTIPVALVPVNTMSGIVTTTALTPTPPHLQISHTYDSFGPDDTCSIRYCSCDYSSYFYVLRDSSPSIFTSGRYRSLFHRCTSDQRRHIARQIYHDGGQRSF